MPISQSLKAIIFHPMLIQFVCLENAHLYGLLMCLTL
jgi:hypothetical protein